MSAVETVAVRWHHGSDHAADGTPFGGPTCNCLTVAERIAPMLAEAWQRGYDSGELCDLTAEDEEHVCPGNPFEADQ